MSKSKHVRVSPPVHEELVQRAKEMEIKTSELADRILYNHLIDSKNDEDDSDYEDSDEDEDEDEVDQEDDELEDDEEEE